MKNKEIKTIYVSLFGKENINDVKSEIILQDAKKYEKAIFKMQNKTNIKVSIPLENLFAIDLSLNSSSPKIKENAYNKNKQNLIILDDFERKSDNIKMKDLFGFFDDLISLNYKLVVVSNLDAFDDDNKQNIQIYKEKIFDRIYEINEIPTDIIHTIFSMYKKEITGLESEFGGNLRLAIKSKNLYEELTNNKRISNLINDSEILMKCSIYVIMEEFTQRYSSCELLNDENCKICNDPRVNCICKYDSQMYGYISLLKAVFEVVEKNDFSKILSYYKNEKNDILDERTFYLSDQHKKELITKQYNKIINIKKCSQNDETKIVTTLKDWIACKVKVNGIDINKIFNIMYDNNIEFIANEEPEKILKAKYDKYVKDKKLNIIKNNLKSKNMKVKRQAIALINNIGLDDEIIGELEKIIESNDFLYEKLNGDIDYESWEFNNMVTYTITSIFVNIAEKAKAFLEGQLLKYPDDISCKERIEYLIEKYD